MRGLLPLLLFAVALLALGAAQPGHAETLNRCIGPQGSVSYQNTACGPGSRLDRTLDYRPDASPAVSPESRLYRYEPLYRSYSSRSRSRSRSRQLGATTSTPSAICSAAKDRRRAELERIGLRRTFDQLSRLDATVREACHGY